MFLIIKSMKKRQRKYLILKRSQLFSETAHNYSELMLTAKINNEAQNANDSSPICSLQHNR